VIPSSFIDEILARTDIVDVIEARVTLKKTGQNYSGLCPFHQEKSPSFSVSQEKQFYYCFGCQASGSAIKFLMEFDRMDFVTAIENLAARLGMVVPNEQSDDDRLSSMKRKQTLDVLTQAKDFYKQQLRNHPQRQRAVDYLKNRGLTGQIANRFEIGFAPPGWQNLSALFSEDAAQLQPWIAAGLMVENLDEDKRYDRFRDRIVFPIRDLRGRTIGFGGRVIGDGKPKYLNSPETTVFHKGRELYGLYEARRSQQKSARLLVVEGYMDVVALAQHGIEYAVATLGTSTSDEHIQRMYRQVSEIVFCFDGDGAGLRAAWKALLGVLPHLSDGRSARFMFLPEGHDPDSLVRKEGTERFGARIDGADDVSTWFFEKLGQDLQVDGLDPKSIAGRAALSKTAMPLINLMPEGVFRQLMIDALAELTGLARGRLEDVTIKYQLPAEPQSVFTDGPDELSEMESGEYDSEDPREVGPLDPALSLLILQPELALEFNIEDYQNIDKNMQDRLIKSIAVCVHEGSISAPGQILARFNGRDEQYCVKKAFEHKPLLRPEHLKDEYVGLMQRKFDQYRSSSARIQINQLLDKAPSQLTEDERALIRLHIGSID